MPPIEVRRERLVVVPVDVLWEIVAPAETTSSWLPICDRCEAIAGEGLGRRQRMHVRWGRRDAEIDQEVIEYAPPSGPHNRAAASARLRWRQVEERMNGRAAPRISTDVTTTVELHAVGAGTRVVLTSSSTPAGRWSALVLRVVAAPRIRRAFDRALERLAGASRDQHVDA
jgi:hypothetical protein